MNSPEDRGLLSRIKEEKKRLCLYSFSKIYPEISSGLVFVIRNADLNTID